LILVIRKGATMEKEPLKCKKFDSYTSPCTKRDNEALTELRGFISVEGFRGTISNDIFDKAKAVCMTCNDFEPES
jgi:hypothetical protein